MKKFKKLGGAAIDLEQAYRQAMKYGGRMQYQYSGQMNPEDAAATDKAMYEYANTKKGIPTQILNKSQYGDMDQTTLGRPTMGQYKGYDIKKDDYSVSPYMDEIVDEPTRVINTVKAEDARKTSNFAERQSAAKAAGTTKSGRSKEILNYINEALPGTFAFEAREGDETLGIIGPDLIMKLRSKGLTNEQIKNITEDDFFNPDTEVGKYIKAMLPAATTRSTTSGEKGFGSVAQGDKGSNMLTPEGRFFMEALNNNARFTPSYLRDKGAKAGLKMNDDQLDVVGRSLDAALARYNQNPRGYNINNPEDVARLLSESGVSNNKDVKAYFESIKPKAISESREDLVRLRSKEETVENKPEVKQTTNIQPGNKLTYNQGFAKTTQEATPGASYFRQDKGQPNKPVVTQGASFFRGTPNKTSTPTPSEGYKPGTQTSQTAGRTQSGSSTTPATRQTTIETTNQPKSTTVKKYYTEPIKYKDGGQFSMDNARVLYRKGINNFEPRNAYQYSGQVDPLAGNKNITPLSEILRSNMNRGIQTFRNSPQVQQYYNAVKTDPFYQKRLDSNDMPMKLDPLANPRIQYNQQVPTYEHMNPNMLNRYGVPKGYGKPKAQHGLNVPNPQAQEPKQFNPNVFDVNKLEANQMYKNIYPQLDSAGRPLPPVNKDPFSEEMIDYNKALYEYNNPQETYEHLDPRLRKRFIPKQNQMSTRQMGGPMSWVEKNRIMKYGR